MSRKILMSIYLASYIKENFMNAAKETVKRSIHLNRSVFDAVF